MHAERGDALARLRDRHWDVLVVGGGIVGSGIARDLALRGFSVALVEAVDLAWGTTSRPTRLIHGGLRYLEMFDFGLVRSDMREREILLRIAPHLVTPLPFLMPLYDTSLAYQAKLRTGMQLYDLLSYDKSLPPRRWLSRDEVLRAEPTIKRDGLQGAWRFYDAQVAHVERLVVENALDAASSGAQIVNHARVQCFLRSQDGRVVGARVRDELGGHEMEVRARMTINASGPWLDQTFDDIRAGKRPLLRLTKGVHLVTPSSTNMAHVLFARTDGRLFFVVPWLGRTLIGTTDTDFSGNPADAAATEDDVLYLQREAGRAFPEARFVEVLYTWAGVRALVRVEGVVEGKVSRKHALHDHATQERVPGLLSVVGGKITAYRGIAEEVGDRVAQAFGVRRLGYTAQRQLPGGLIGAQQQAVQQLWPEAEHLGLDRGQVENLARVYGSLAQRVLEIAAADTSLTQRLCPHQPTIAAELVRAVREEWAATLADLLLRRTGFALTGCVDGGCLRAVAERCHALFGWDAEEQLDAYRRETAPMFRFDPRRQQQLQPSA